MSIIKDEFPPEYLECIRKMRLIDDTFFAVCMEDNKPFMNLLLQLVLEREDLQVTEVVTQRTAPNLYGRSVRFDVLATDTDGNIYNCEVQRAEEGAIPRRARYNSSMIDNRELAKGTDYSELPETYVIFITENDTFAASKPLYHIERTLREIPQNFNDGSHIIYVNASYQDNTPLGKLMQDFFETDASKMHYPELADRTDYFKNHTKGVNTMCKIMEEFGHKLEEKARAEGAKAAVRENALRMLAKGKYTFEEIAEITELSLEEIRSLANEKTA